jgi:hypothetical protein
MNKNRVFLLRLKYAHNLLKSRSKGGKEEGRKKREVTRRGEKAWEPVLALLFSMILD